MGEEDSTDRCVDWTLAAAPGGSCRHAPSLFQGNGSGRDVPSRNSQLDTTENGGGRQVVGGYVARFARHQFNVIVIPKHGKDLLNLARLAYSQADLKREVVAGVSQQH